LRLSFDPGGAPPEGADAIRPDGSWDLEKLTDEQLDELASEVARAEGVERTKRPADPAPVAEKAPARRVTAKPTFAKPEKAEPHIEDRADTEEGDG
jgi:topoisomerase IA-like protein